ncbi:MAG: tetratricopeptide repeat protein [Candidatus Aureabacteria bacterium]|nr:tetratricopeptide repeat protein [Candidatus Auribacterota bacterium]
MLKGTFKKQGMVGMALFMLLGSLVVTADEASDLAAEVASRKKVYAEESRIIAEQHFKLGKEYLDEGNYDRALDEFKTVLELDPNHVSAKKYRLKAIEAIAGVSGSAKEGAGEASPFFDVAGYNPQGAFQAYQRGVDFYNKGNLEKAIKEFHLSMRMNPHYVPAKRFINRILCKERESLARDEEIALKKRIIEVDQAWLPPEKADKLTIRGAVSSPEIITEAKRKMMQASKQVIPEINFTQAHLRDVLQYLSKITGVNIILDERVFETAAMPMAPGGDAGGMDAERAVMSAPLSETITISLTNIPLIEALRYILKVKGLKYRIDDYAIMVSTPEGIGDEEMETRYYTLSSGIADFTEFKLNEDATNVGGVKAGGSSGSSSFGGLGMSSPDMEKTSVKDILMNSGVPFPPGSNVFMDRRTGTLIVHNTPENLAMVEKILDIIDKPPFQVNIQAKFIHINQTDLDELGFEWLLMSPIRVGTHSQMNADGTQTNRMQINSNFLNSGYSPSTWGVTDEFGDPINQGVFLNNALGAVAGLEDQYAGAVSGVLTKGDQMPNYISNGGILSLSGILTDPQFNMVMHALDKSGNADLLSAPQVTTVNNQQAQIELVTEIIYPGKYEVVQPVVSNGTQTTPGYTVPADFITRDVGVILNVTPSVGADRKTITLTLIPEVSEYLRDIDWGYDLPVAGSTLKTHMSIKQPIFKTSNVSTTVIVNDGETIVLGGLIEEAKTKIRDKIPFLGSIPLLGRLFRHDLDETRKVNLMIFVTAKLITADGDDLHSSKKEIAQA